MCSYIFVSMAYGIMMEDAGFKWYYSLLVSLTVYTGAFQFVLITLFKQRSFYYNSGSHSTADEQPPEIFTALRSWKILRKWENGCFI